MVLLGASGMSIDAARVNLAYVQLDTAAMAGGLAAQITLRDGGTVGSAATNAGIIANQNMIDASFGNLTVSVSTGNWDWDNADPDASFASGGETNSVDISVARDTGSVQFPLFMAPLLPGVAAAIDLKMESSSAIRRRETVFVVDSDRAFDQYQDEVLSAINAHTMEMFDHGQMLDMLGLIQYTGEGQVRASIQDITGVGAPDVMAIWSDLDSCNQDIATAWQAYWRFRDDVPSVALGGTADLRARSSGGTPGWTDADEEFYAIIAGMDTTTNGKSDCQECEESALADNTQCTPADPYDDPAADRDYCSWLISYAIFENFTDVYDVGNPSTAPFCHLGNEYEFHASRYDTGESIAVANSPTHYAASFSGGDKDRYFAEFGTGPGLAADMAVTELTSGPTNELAVKNVIVIAGDDPYCHPEATPNGAACQSTVDADIITAGNNAATNNVNIFVVYVGNLTVDTTDLQNLVTGSGYYAETDDPAAELDGLLLDIARVAPVVVTR